MAGLTQIIYLDYETQNFSISRSHYVELKDSTIKSAETRENGPGDIVPNIHERREGTLGTFIAKFLSAYVTCANNKTCLRSPRHSNLVCIKFRDESSRRRLERLLSLM